MNSRQSLAIFIALTGALLTSCNSNDDPIYSGMVDTTVTNVQVKSMTLGVNENIVENLDSVFFTIDLANARIFNADSLPVGSKLGKTTVSLELPTVSKAEIVFTDGDERKTVNYLESPNDSINFAAGDVMIRLVSADASVMREYKVSLNVHEKKPDSLYWDAEPIHTLPTSLSATLISSATVEHDGRFYTLTKSASGASLAVADSPADENVSAHTVALPASADVSSFTSDGNSLYIIAGGLLYSSADGSAWRSTGVRMNHVYGNCNGTILGARRNSDGSYTHVSYPDGDGEAVPASCPVSATSGAVVYTSEWSDNPMLIITGGRTASGDVTGSTWAYDGAKWACISIQPVADLEGMIQIPYWTISVDNQWRVTTTPVLLALGGRDAEGEYNSTVYMSLDRGVHWAKAPACMQSDDRTPLVAGASAFVHNVTLSDTEASRAVKPIENWECPYIYIYGGSTPESRLNDGVLRGVINHFTFKPIQ